MVKPLTPQEVAKQKQESIPDEVITIVNELLVKHWSNITKQATIKQDEIVSLIVDRLEVEREHVFESGWLDFETIFRSHGWEVTHDQPGYNESYDAYFEFKQPTPSRGGWRD